MRTFFYSMVIVGLVGCAPISINISVGTTPTPNQPPTSTAPPPSLPSSTSTPDAQATSAAQLQATTAAQSTAAALAQATNAAQSTATAQARSTASAQQTAAVNATAQAFAAFAIALAQSSKVAFGPNDGVLDKPADPVSIKTLNSNVYFRNLVAEAVFTNPADGAIHPWDYGFLFRRTPAGKCAIGYRFYISFDQTYRLVLASGKTLPDQTCEVKEISRSKLTGLNVSVNGTNSVRLIVQDKLAFVFLNDVYQALLDVSEVGEQGDVIIGSAFEVTHNFPGLATPFKKFVVSSLP